MIYIGIDPGKHGAVAVLNDKGICMLEKFFDKTTKDISDILNSIPKFKEPLFAFIEKVNAYPDQGVHSVFVFGENYGILQGLLIAHEIPFDYVSPQKWKKFMGCISPTGSTHTEKKNLSKGLAQRLFPKIKITHDISEALLLAEYCRRTKEKTYECG